MVGRFKELYTLLLLFCLIQPNQALSQPLIVLFGSHNAEPYAFIEDDILVGGIVKDIGDELGELLNMPIEYINVPRKRMEYYLLSGEAHIRLMANPEWVKDPEKYKWSKPLFEEFDSFVVSKQKSFKIDEFSDLKNKVLGTIHGYYYPSLAELFRKQEITRDDTNNMVANFRRLELGRIDSFIDSNISIAYYLKKHQAYDRFSIAEKVAAKHQIQAMMSPSIPISFNRINEAFDTMKKNGKVQEILQKYR